MSKVQVVVLFVMVCVFLLSGCSQNGLSLFSTSTPTSTITQTPTPTLTFTPTITPTITVTPIPSSTPYPLASCSGNEAYVGAWTLEEDEMLFEAFLCPDNTLIAVLHNQEFSDPITINRKSRGSIEYSWEVFVDVDANKSTGLPERNYTGVSGAEYMLTLAHWSSGSVKTIPFNQAFQINVWRYNGESISKFSNAELYADKVNQLIILKGKIPDITTYSQLYFYHVHLNSDNKLSYRTEWATSNPSP